MNKPFVLVVDDEAEARSTIINFLNSRYDCEFKEAENGNEAIEYIKANPCDVMILDIKMPKINGLEVCQRLKNNSELRSVKIIAITGNSRTYTREITIDSGADEYLVKPFDSENLFSLIEKLLGKRAVV